MKTLLVIGGSGFFGKSILDAFSRKLLTSWQITKVIVIARSADKLIEFFPELIGVGVEILSIDISKADSLPAADYVIHAAASSNAANYLNAGEEERRNILAGTLNYCRLAKAFNKNTKTLYVSSGAVYGTQSPGMSNIDECYAFENPDNIPEGKRDYVAAKRDAEKIIKNLGEEGFPVSIARCFAFVGQYLPRDQHFAIGNFINDGLAGKSIKVKSNHHVFRSYMYADDLVEWLMVILVSANQDCPIVNVGSNEAIDLRSLASKIGKVFSLEVVAPLLDTSICDRYVPSVDRALNKYGLRLKYGLDDAIDETLKKIRNQNEKNT